ncbi:MAG: hypothetical protein LBJ62_00775 [Bifidobacteriaceae bacterium]|jgi:hypothetical protein|nr:hypothetical protein [Bifidobacteriaceae bacterium]
MLFQLLMWAVPVAILAALVQVVDQLFVGKLKGIGPFKAGGGWVAFQAWALYFLIFYMTGGVSSTEGPSPLLVIAQGLLGYAVGIVAAILIFEFGAKLGKTGFWAMPISLFVLCIPALFWGIADNPVGVNPALFLGAAVFFCIMSYYPQVPGAFKEGSSQWSKYGNAALGELVYCLIGLPCGYLTLVLGEALLSLFGVTA